MASTVGGEKRPPPQEFRELVEKADRKFTRVRDLPAYGGSPATGRWLHKVFKAYMKVWKFQQQHRAELVGSGLQRWEIGEIASRIGQLYFGQYQRTSEARFLLEAYVFYEAIFHRRYFEVSKTSPLKDPSVRFKELRFYARFLLVALILNRKDTVGVLVDRFKELVDDSRATFRETNFKEWRQVVQEITRFVNAEKGFPNTRPLRYCALFDTHQDSLRYVARFHAKKVLKLQEAVLTSYHRSEVKFAELTLDTFRMLQCLEWEPSGSFYQKHQNEAAGNGFMKDYSGTSGLIDINLAADLTDPSLPPNPKKAVLYRPTSTQLVAAIATMCEELPPDSIMLVYVSSSSGCCLFSGEDVLLTQLLNLRWCVAMFFSGSAGSSSSDSSGGSRRFSKSRALFSTSHDPNSSPEVHDNKKGYISGFYDSPLCLGSRGIGGSNNLYPGDLLPFTRRPLFLVIDSDSSHAFKVIHGAERGEPSALFLSPSRPSFKSPSSVNVTQYGSQFTFFLTAPLQAFCQLVGLSTSDRDKDVYDEAEKIITNAFSKWEVMLCSSTRIDLVWAQVLPDPFLRRLILRFIFCRAVLSLFHPAEARDSYVPECLPHLPGFMSPDSDAVESCIRQLAGHLKVSEFFDNT